MGADHEMATHSAMLHLPFGRLTTALRPVCEALSLPVEQTAEDAATVQLPGGALIIAAQDAGCRLMLEAADEGHLAQLRERVTHYLSEQGLGTMLEWQADRRAARPANMTIARIDSSIRLSPSFQRLRLSGDFARFRDSGLHFRLIFGPEGADWPTSDETGTTVWPGGIDTWHRPPYTIRAMDPDCRWIDVDVVLHAGGRVTDWATACQPGDEVALTGPGGKVPQIAGWIGYVGDETALPVIARMLEILPAGTRGTARIFVPDPRDAQGVRHPAGVDLQWLVRGRDGTLLDAVKALVPPASDRFLFVAAERHEAAAARDHLAGRGLGRGEYHCANYWTEGWVPPDCQVSRLPHRKAAG